MNLSAANPALLRKASEVRAREAVLLFLCDARPTDCAYLGDLSAEGWQRLLLWLDTSGLALYFLDRVIELEQTAIISPTVLGSLHQRLADNIARTESMMIESAELHREFQRAGLCYATLKGFSLWPHSVPKPELRSQLDLDFMVGEDSAIEARQILEARGYHLRAVSGQSWEFKTRETPGTSLDRLYKAAVCRSTELHIESRERRKASPLSRIQRVCFRGVLMPVLSPVDLFLGQGLHLFKHVCSEFSRTAHWLEFRRHVTARYNDSAFWWKLKAQGELNPRVSTALGVVTLLITQVTGEFAPEALTRWTVDCLPAGAQRWVDFYGGRAAFMSFPGNKLYLLLQKELAGAGVQAERPLWRALMPTRLPPPVVDADEKEDLAARLRRNRMQVWFVFFRLRFHVLQGLNYLCESIRWRFYSAGEAQ